MTETHAQPEGGDSFDDENVDFTSTMNALRVAVEALGRLSLQVGTMERLVASLHLCTHEKAPPATTQAVVNRLQAAIDTYHARLDDFMAAHNALPAFLHQSTDSMRRLEPLQVACQQVTDLLVQYKDSGLAPVHH